MPLVWQLTGEFKGYFTPGHVRELNAGWLQQGGGYDKSVIETTIALLNRDDLHYENILGCLQTVSKRIQQAFAEQYDEMYQRMVETVYLLLYHRQAGSLPYITQGLAPFEGLAVFVKKSSPVWAFSLNHAKRRCNSAWEASRRRKRTNVRIIWMFTSTARLLRNTLESMATPCSVNA